MKKKLKLIIPIGIIVVVLVSLVLCLLFGKSRSELSKYADKTSAGESSGYKLDLRIWGTYEKKRINKIVVVSNYKNQDKTVKVSNLVSSNPLLGKSSDDSAEKSYVIKGDKKYELVNEELKDVKDVPYEDSEIYLDGINYMKKIKKEKDQTISTNTYSVYKGVVSKNTINRIAKATDIQMTFDKDCEVEVWLTKDSYVYKVYYRVDNMTIYASYFGIGKTGKINLDEYKKEAV